MNDSSVPRPGASVLDALRTLSILIGTLVLAAVLSKVSLEGDLTVSPRRLLLIVCGFALLVTALVVRRLPAQIGLSAFVLVVSLIAAIGASIALGIPWPTSLQPGSAGTTTQADPPKPVGIWTEHERYGYFQIPGSSGNHVHPAGDFDVTYTLDDEAFRVTPTPADPKGTILIAGCSYMFGHGLDDEEAIPYLLGKLYWKDYKVKNLAVMGWGPAHGHLILEDQLRQGEAPSLVIYGLIPSQMWRSYIRREWIAMINQFAAMFGVKRDHPHFELVDGKLEYQGVINVDQSKPLTPEMQEKEVELTLAFLRGMQAMCRSKDVPFLVVILPSAVRHDWDDDPYYAHFVDELLDSDIPILSLTHLPVKAFEHDNHPTPEEAARIARALGVSVELPR